MPCSSGWLRFWPWALVGQAPGTRGHQIRPFASPCLSPAALPSLLCGSQSTWLRLALRQRFTAVLEPLLDPQEKGSA